MNKQCSGRSGWLLYLLLPISAVAYYWLCYQTNRQNFPQVFVLYTAAFAAYYFLIRLYAVSHLRLLLVSGVVFRILLLFSVPNLSDDIYRFIWDGKLLASGVNPLHQLPVEVIKSTAIPGITNELYRQLNSPGYYTIYPPVLQGIFWFSAKATGTVGGAIICMKTIILLAEIGTMLLLPFVLQRIQLPKHFSIFYVLNPLVIAELTGNVHFDAVMIFFLMLAFLLLLDKKVYLSAIFLGLSISSKLVPVLFIPLVIKKLGWSHGLIYSAISGFVTIILFAFFIDKVTVYHFLGSINLFLSHFEFNASLYYIIRWSGTLITGYNIIGFAGPLLSITAAVIIFILSFRGGEISERQFFTRALIILTVYYLFATTVHPWYICMPVALAVFTPYRYAIIWSFTATFSYAAYQTNPTGENLWLVGGEYLIMIGYAFWEFKIKRKLNQDRIK